MPNSVSSAKQITWSYVIAAAISLIGLGDAIYLTIQDLTGQNLRCTIITGCAEVLGSKYAHIGSIPLATVGAVAYFTFFSLAILAAFDYSLARPLLLILVAMMFLTALWLTYLQAFVIHHFCQYCLLSASVTTVLTAIAFWIQLTRRRKPNL
ncbi:MAG TPA: vitamin K epoxide reductase family protein [Pyrinomonadaceae bacterium]|jgi:uncharacterized membrane protein|nr:vitamin K epoxide reductase family protein [Pyrinomonadaceae bacterium]